MTRDQFERQIVIKASKDAAFRKALIADPKGTLQAELQALKAGVTLPAHLKVSVVEESPNHIYLRLPAASAAMSEPELAAMTGGASPEVGIAISGAIALDVTASVDPVATVVTGTDVVVTPGLTYVV